MKQQFRLTLALISLLLTSMAASSVIADELFDDGGYSGSGRDKRQIYHLFFKTDLIPTTDIRYAKPRVVAKFLFPKLEGSEEDDSIESFNETIADYLQEEYKSFQEQVANNRLAQEDLPNKDVKNDLNIDFASSIINADNSPIISVRFAVRGYITGRMEPYSYHHTLNYNMDTGDEMQLSDQFLPDADYLNILAQFSYHTLTVRVKDKVLLAAGTAPKPENYRNWNMTPYGFLITFDGGQAAPLILGTQTVLVPYADIAETLAPTSPAAACLNHRKKCIRNNVLTGGFIDTALKTSHGVFNPRLGVA